MGRCFFFVTGAQSTVIGHPQALVYCRFMNVKFRPSESDIGFLFGETRCASLGSTTIRIPSVDLEIICERVEIVFADARFLDGIGLLDKYELYKNNV